MSDSTIDREFGPVDGEPLEHSAMRFLAGMSGIQKAAHELAVAKGWWDTPRNELELFFLIQSEVTEMGEAARVGNPPSDKLPHLSSIAEEAADVVIRLMDYCEQAGIDLGGAVIDKLTYNAGRPYRHGNKLY